MFSAAEYEDRRRKTIRLMDERQIDALLLTTKEDIDYFTGLRVPFSYIERDRPFIAGIRRDGPPFFVMPYLREHYVRECVGSGQLPSSTEVFTWGGHLSHGFPRELFQSTIAALTDLGLKESTIGMEFGDTQRLDMPYNQFIEVQRQLPHVAFVDATDIIWTMRMIKSQSEKECLKKACDITCAAVQSVFQSLHEGVTGAQIARQICCRMLENGSDWTKGDSLHVSVIRKGEKCDTNTRIEKGDMVMADGGAAFDGYHADILRWACLGRPDSKQERLLDLALEANKAAIAALVPGRPIKDAFSAGMELFANTGYGAHMVNEKIGHGIGLELHEPPAISAENSTTIKQGMTVTIDPAPCISGVYYAWENVLFVTEHGTENLVDMKENLIEIH